MGIEISREEGGMLLIPSSTSVTGAFRGCVRVSVDVVQETLTCGMLMAL